MGPVGDHAPQAIGGHGPTTLGDLEAGTVQEGLVTAAASAHRRGGPLP